jgi:hypothetical protein
MSGRGFLSRLRGNRETTPPSAQRPFELALGGYSKVVGESHYQDALARTAKLAHTELDEQDEERLCFDALLLREPSNVYDTRAVAVYSRAGLVGYVPRDSSWCELLDLLAQRGHDGARCRANVTGGEPGRSWGVVLHARPELEFEQLTTKHRDQ